MSITQARRRYLWTLLAAFIAALVATATINVVIDPYGSFRLAKLPGLNRVKPNPDHDIEFIKAHALHDVPPEALILGNSRAEVGFDPAHPVWQEAGYGVVYNAAIRGSAPSTARRLLQRAADGRPPKWVLLGIDFLDFPIAPNAPSVPAQESNTTWSDEARWLLRATLTMQALLDSATTIYRQFQINPDELTDKGQTPLRNYRDMAKAEGYWTFFSQRAAQNAKTLSRKPNNLYLQGTRSSPDFDEVRRIVRWSLRNDAQLRLVIYPYHAQLLVMIDELGLWELFDEWKRQMLRIVEEETAGGSARGRIALIDFSGFSVYAQEPIPARDDKQSTTRWYWEAGHFKTELGNIMLKQMLSGSAQPDPGAFGVELNTLNIERHIERLHGSRDAFRAGHPEMVAEVRGMVTSARKALADQVVRP